eukprot:2837218-Alexandrium_andersonii.AAC.1
MEGPGGDHAVIANVIRMHRQSSMTERRLAYTDVRSNVMGMVGKQETQLESKKSSACAFYLISGVFDDKSALVLESDKRTQPALGNWHPSNMLWATVDFRSGPDLSGCPP